MKKRYIVIGYYQRSEDTPRHSWCVLMSASDKWEACYYAPLMADKYDDLGEYDFAVIDAEELTPEKESAILTAYEEYYKALAACPSREARRDMRETYRLIKRMLVKLYCAIRGLSA